MLFPYPQRQLELLLLYERLLLFLGLLSRRDVEKGSRGLLILLLYISLLMQPYKLLSIPPPLMLQDRLKMLVFDRPSFFPLTLLLLSCSPLYSLFIHFDSNA